MDLPGTVALLSAADNDEDRSPRLVHSADSALAYMLDMHQHYEGDARVRTGPDLGSKRPH